MGHTGADYCITVHFQRGSESPSRVFRAMTDLIEAFQETDRALARCVSVNIEPVLLLEDIESGSLRAWLRAKLSGLPDDTLTSGDWKKVVGHFLVKAKHSMLEWSEGKATLTNRADLIALQERLHDAAAQTHVNRIPAYAPPDARALLENMRRVGEALAHLLPADSASYGTDQFQAPFNLQFRVDPEALEDILTAETISNTGVMILKVKKPDYLGASQWDMRHGSRSVQAKFEDIGWLGRFQNRRENVRPGDALRAEVRIEVRYGHDGEVVGEHYIVTRVLAVIEPESDRQIDLLSEK